MLEATLAAGVGEKRQTILELQRFYLILAALWKKEKFSLDLNDVEVHSQIRFKRDQSELFYQCETAETDGNNNKKKGHTIASFKIRRSQDKALILLERLKIQFYHKQTAKQHLKSARQP